MSLGINDKGADPLEPCADAHCILAEKPRKGMHTNGGCQHLKFRGPEQTIFLMYLAEGYVSAKRQVRILREVLGENVK